MLEDSQLVRLSYIADRWQHNTRCCSNVLVVANRDYVMALGTVFGRSAIRFGYVIKKICGE